MIKVGLVGCGYWGPGLARNFYENDLVELKYVCDLQQEKLGKLKKRYPTVIATTNYSDLLNDPELDAIAVATPVDSHYKLAKAALEAGKHVLVEKPMCTTSAECLDLVATAEDRGLTLMVDHTFVYHPAIKRIKSIIESGELGEILYFDSVRINLGLFQSDVNVIWDLAPHDLSIIDYLLGQTPTSVSAFGSCHAGNGIEDIAYINLEFENNLIAHLNVSWLSPVKVRNIMIGGTKKMICYDDLLPAEKIRVYDKGISVTQPASPEKRYENLIQYRLGDMYAPVTEVTEALQTEVAHFVDCVMNKKKPLSDGKAGLRVVQLLELANESLKSRSPRALSLEPAR